MDEALDRWHAVVSAGDLGQATMVVTDPVVVNGPRGVDRLAPTEFADWVERSGISITPRGWHAVSERVGVVSST